MMKKISLNIFIPVLIGVVSCDSKPEAYLNHSIEKPEKIGDCSNYDPKYSMISNIIGERYEFQKCLQSNYNAKYNIERKGDTVVVSFPKGNGPSALYKITLNIDTYPRYNFLTIDGNTVRIIPAGN
jgi:hypothetical protein